MCRGQHDFRLGHNFRDHASLALPKLLAQFTHFLPHLLALGTLDAVLARPVPELILEGLEVLLDVFEERARVRRGGLCIEGVSAETGQDSSGMTDSSERDRLVEIGMWNGESGEDVVHGEV